MSKNFISPFLHEKIKAFKDALQYTEKKTGFIARLIEKDYYCSLILKLLYSESCEIFFKGGTLLNKVHVGFYRLSEDLDFTLSISHKEKRNARRKKAAPFKLFIDSIPNKISGFKIMKPLTGSNESVQYNAEIKYDSVLTGLEDRILFEIGLREEVTEKNYIGKANTLVMDPYSDLPLMSPINIRCLSLLETFAEKIRAALARKKAAIRDLYDVWYAIEKKIIDPENEKLIKFVVQKMTIPEILAIQVEMSRKHEFKTQLETQLKPVLQDKNFIAFDFEKAWIQLLNISKKVKSHDPMSKNNGQLTL